MYTTDVHQLYAQNNINVESPERLVQLLFEGVLRFNLQAKKAIDINDIEKKSYWINRSTKVLVELVQIINYEHGDVAHYLNGLYNYQIQQLALANLQMDSILIDSVNHVIKGLSEAWKDSISARNTL